MNNSLEIRDVDSACVSGTGNAVHELLAEARIGGEHVPLLTVRMNEDCRCVKAQYGSNYRKAGGKSAGHGQVGK